MLNIQPADGTDKLVIVKKNLLQPTSNEYFVEISLSHFQKIKTMRYLSSQYIKLKAFSV